MAVKFNMKILKDQIEPEIERRTINIAREMARDKFEIEKESFLQNLEGDSVSQEILAENSVFASERIIGAGVEKNGANLYSFFGFEISEENPVVSLLAFLRQNISISTATRLRNGVYRFRISAPSRELIESVTPLTWIKRSWIRAVENGLSNVKNYIRVLDGSPFSRSDEGLQIKNSMNKTFKPKRSYFTSKYQRFLTRLTK